MSCYQKSFTRMCRMCTWVTLIKYLGHWVFLNEGSHFLPCYPGNGSLQLTCLISAFPAFSFYMVQLSRTQSCYCKLWQRSSFLIAATGLQVPLQGCHCLRVPSPGSTYVWLFRYFCCNGICSNNISPERPPHRGPQCRCELWWIASVAQHSLSNPLGSTKWICGKANF